jgi:threonine/homoserine/homoserine lactone efflux protein
LVAVAFSTRRARAAYHRFGRWIERVVGTFLAGIGIKLIAEKF